MKTATAGSGPERLLRLKEVEMRVGLKKSSIYAAIRADEFPKPVRLVGKTVAWPESRIDNFIRTRIDC